jgi:plastocyanin
MPILAAFGDPLSLWNANCTSIKCQAGSSNGGSHMGNCILPGVTPSRLEVGMGKTTWFSLFLTIALAGQLAAQTGFRGLAIDGNLIFPQIAIGGGYTTDVLLQNPGNVTDVSGTLYFFDSLGFPLTLRYNGTSVTQISMSVPRGSIKKITLTISPDVLTVGWAIFVTLPGTPDPLPEIFGSVIYTNVSGTTLLTQTGVPGTRYSAGNFGRITIPIQVVNSLSTGIAVVNAGSAALNVTFELKDANGNVVSSDTPLPISPLAPGTHIAKYVTEIFPSTPLNNFLGSLDLVTDGEGMVALGLILNGPVISTIPVINAPAPSRTVTVVDVGDSFSPATVTIKVGDTIAFALSGSHDAVEVSKATWDANRSTSNGGFSIPFGGGSHTFTQPGTYYYVCVAHVALGMKGMIIVN